MNSNNRAYFHCSVAGCIRSTLNTKDISFFSIPPNEERRLHWLKLIDREDLVDKSPSSYRVCEVHFSPDVILTSSSRKRLKKDAKPTLLLPNRKYKNIGCQATVQTAEAFTFSHLHLQRRSVGFQTPKYLSNNSSLPKSPSSDNEMSAQKEQTEKQVKSETFPNLCDQFLNKNLSNIVKEHAKLKLNCLDNKYSLNYKIFCLNLFYVSPEAYNLLKDTLCLPSPDLLKSMHIPMKINVNDKFMVILKTKVDQMTVMEKNCTIVMGAMTLRAKLFYNIREDKIYGFHEIDGNQSAKPAKYALVAMIQGIFSKYQLPVGYALVAERQYYENVVQWTTKLIRQLQEIGLNVRAFVSDMTFDFLSTDENNAVSSDRPYFYVDNKKIFCFVDPPHLITSVRNVLIDCDFYFSKYVAKWEHILELYDKDKSKGLRIAPKLTQSHVRPSDIEKSKVKLSAQVLSAAVAAGVYTYSIFGAIDSSAEGTSRLVKKMNDIFDLLNSSSLNGSTIYKNAYMGEEYQIDFINDALHFLDSLKCIERNDEKDVTTSVEFIEGFKITLKSLLLLFEDLSAEGYTHIITKRLNQDCLGNFFDRLRTRNGNLKEPNSWQFVSAFRKKFFWNIFKFSNNLNCDDLSHILQEQSNKKSPENEILIKQEDSVATVSTNEEYKKERPHAVISTRDYNNLDLPTENTIFYICGYLLKKCADHHNECNEFRLYINNCNEAPQHTNRMPYKYRKETSGTELIMTPPNDFINFVEALEVILTKNLAEQYAESNILSLIFLKLENLAFVLPCPCFPLTYCKKLYLRLKLYYTLKFNNRVIRRGRRQYFSVPIYE